MNPKATRTCNWVRLGSNNLRLLHVDSLAEWLGIHERNHRITRWTECQLAKGAWLKIHLFIFSWFITTLPDSSHVYYNTCPLSLQNCGSMYCGRAVMSGIPQTYVLRLVLLHLYQWHRLWDQGHPQQVCRHKQVEWCSWYDKERMPSKET